MVVSGLKRLMGAGLSLGGLRHVRYNEGLQRLSGRRSCPARGRNVHLTPEGSDAVLRGGNERLGESVFCEIAG